MKGEMRSHGLIDISEDRGQRGQAMTGRMESAGWGLWLLRVVGYYGR